jgi:hypothetical protein
MLFAMNGASEGGFNSTHVHGTDGKTSQNAAFYWCFQLAAPPGVTSGLTVQEPAPMRLPGRKTYPRPFVGVWTGLGPSGIRDVV